MRCIVKIIFSRESGALCCPEPDETSFLSHIVSLKSILTLNLIQNIPVSVSDQKCTFIQLSIT
jgi:hypothetical protein